VQVMVLEPEFVAFASLSEDALGADPAGNLEVMIAARTSSTGWRPSRRVIKGSPTTSTGAAGSSSPPTKRS
jgi:hypothetical protein